MDTMIDTTWWLIADRLFVQIFVIVGITMIFRRLSTLIAQGQDDAKARMASAERLERVTADLSERTSRALNEHNAKMMTKLDETKETAVAAASASRDAAASANSMNEKIHDTNTRILDQARSTAVTKQMEATKEILEHVDANQEIGKATLKKATSIDEKVDVLADPKRVKK